MKRWMAVVFFGLHVSMGPSAQAEFAGPQPVPIARILKQAEEFVQKHPRNAQGHYTLGRIHYLAFSIGRQSIPSFGSRREDELKDLPEPAQSWMDRWERTGEYGGRLDEKAVVEHARLALASFLDAKRLDPNDELTLLGIGSLSQEVLNWRRSHPAVALPAELLRIDWLQVWTAYERAFRAGMLKAKDLKYRPLGGLAEIAAYEAAQAMLRLGKDESAAFDDARLRAFRDAEDAVEKFEHLPFGGVTPLVAALHPIPHLADLLAPGARVDFDLRGYGPHDTWPWVKPQLGILVWDPLQTGVIESARQLFGNYTFEIFRRDGYAALAALDDDHDGSLRGAELEGLSIWFDRNGNGRSDPGEVQTVQSLSIQALAVTADGTEGPHLRSSHGMRLANGEVLPTWDWMAAPQPRISPAAQR